MILAVAAPEGRSRVGFSLCEAAEGVRSVWGGGIPLPIRLGVWGSVVSSPSGVWGGAAAEIDFGAFCH